VQTVPSLDALQPATEARTMFICGGAELYAQALPRCSDLYLTLVKREVEGDVFFPAFETLFEPVEQVMETPEFTVVHYRNAHPRP
jgi:dihydrofolate reductase